MRRISTTTGAEIILDCDLLAIMEALYREVTAKRELERSFEDMVREIQHLIAQMDDSERREELFSKGSGYLLYHVLDDLFDYCFPILDKIGTKLDAIEGAIFEERSEEVVRDISNAKQEIIAYRKIIKPERATLRLLERSTLRFLPENLELYFDDIVDASERIWDLLDNYKEVIDGLESTNESFISHKQQYRLQLLTVVSVILLPLTLLASVFGMNVAVPGEGSTGPFWVLVGFMVALGVGLLVLFRWRRWL